MRTLLLLTGILMTTNCAQADEPGWVDTASAATRLAPGQLDTAQQAIGALPEASQAKVTGALDTVAGSPRSLAGYQQATTAVRDGLRSVADPAADGPTPEVHAFQKGAACVLQGVVVQTGKAVAEGSPEDATALIEAVKGTKVLGDALPAILVQEVRQGLGPELYIKSLPK